MTNRELEHVIDGLSDLCCSIDNDQCCDYKWECRDCYIELGIKAAKSLMWNDLTKENKKMPKDGKRVLVKVKSPKGVMIHITTHSQYGWANPSNWNGHRSCYSDESVIAWRELC